MIISVPAFGERYRTLFLETTLPRFLASAREIKARWIIHTDSPRMVEALQASNTLRDAEYWPIAECGGYGAFIQAHRDAFVEADDGEVVFFLCADMVVSVNAFRYALDRIAGGDLAVVTACHRVLDNEPPRTGMDAGELTDFAMNRPHPVTRECFFPWGYSALPVNVYFTRDGHSIVMRAMHLHPFAVVKRDTEFYGTIDNDLLNDYPRDRIHIVQNREIAAVDLTPRDRNHGHAGRLTAESISECYRQRCSPLHKWYFDHPIRISGAGDCGDETVVQAIKRSE